jgi:hypothetical protein
MHRSNVAPVIEDDEIDELEITVPAALRYVRVLRLAAAGTLSLSDLDVDFVDDVRSAVGEAAALALGEHGAPGTLRLHLRSSDDCVEVEVEGTFARQPERTTEEDDLSRHLLGPLVDHYTVDVRNARVTFSKRR